MDGPILLDSTGADGSPVDQVLDQNFPSMSARWLARGWGEEMALNGPRSEDSSECRLKLTREYDSMLVSFSALTQ